MTATKLTAAIFSGLALAIITAQATPITVTNAGFETSPITEVVNFVSGAPSGWTYVGSAGQGIMDPNSTNINGSGNLAAASAPEGAQYYISNGGYLSQTLGATYNSSLAYTARVAVVTRSDAGFGGGSLQLWAGGTQIGTVSLSDPGSGSSNLAQLVVAPGQSASGTLELRLASTGIQTGFDNVTLSDSSGPSAVPEPSTILLFCVGGALMLRTGRKLLKA